MKINRILRGGSQSSSPQRVWNALPVCLKLDMARVMEHGVYNTNPSGFRLVRTVSVIEQLVHST